MLCTVCDCIKGKQTENRLVGGFPLNKSLWLLGYRLPRWRRVELEGILSRCSFRRLVEFCPCFHQVQGTNLRKAMALMQVCYFEKPDQVLKSSTSSRGYESKNGGVNPPAKRDDGSEKWKFFRLPWSGATCMWQLSCTHHNEVAAFLFTGSRSKSEVQQTFCESIHGFDIFKFQGNVYSLLVGGLFWPSPEEATLW